MEDDVPGRLHRRPARQFAAAGVKHDALAQVDDDIVGEAARIERPDRAAQVLADAGRDIPVPGQRQRGRHWGRRDRRGRRRLQAGLPRVREMASQAVSAPLQQAGDVGPAVEVERLAQVFPLAMNVSHQPSEQRVLRAGTGQELPYAGAQLRGAKAVLLRALPQ